MGRSGQSKTYTYNAVGERVRKAGPPARAGTSISSMPSTARCSGSTAGRPGSGDDLPGGSVRRVLEAGGALYYAYADGCGGVGRPPGRLGQR